MDGTILLTWRCGNTAEYSVIWFAFVSVNQKVPLVLLNFIGLLSYPGAAGTPIAFRIFTYWVLIGWLSLQAPPLPRTSRRKMSNPQPGLLNHGNVYGTTVLSSESKSCFYSLAAEKNIVGWLALQKNGRRLCVYLKWFSRAIFNLLAAC